MSAKAKHQEPSYGSLAPQRDGEPGVSSASSPWRQIPPPLVNPELLANAERFRLLAETLSDVIWTMDLDQNITYASPAITELTGHSVATVLGMTLSDLLSSDSFAVARETLLEELRLDKELGAGPHRTRTLDLQLQRSDQTSVWCEVKMNFLRDFASSPKGTLVLARDISSWREAQEALEVSEERLQRAQRLEAVGQLAGGIAHDFNNLLTVIIGNNELMLRELSMSDRLHSQAQEIGKAAQRAATLTRQLFAFGRKQVMLPKLLNLNDVVRETTEMLRGLLGEDIELTLSLHPALARVLADPSQIELALVNLTLNARDAMPSGGRLVIETANAHLDADQGGADFSVIEGPYVLLAVSDTGTGIPRDEQRRIFEPFYTTKAVGKGTGLGLSTVYGIVKQSGGYIWVTSTPGNGARFEILLPRSEAAATFLPPDSEEPVPGSGSQQRIFLVEDEPGVRSLTATILQHEGYEVRTAASAEEAMAMISDFEFDLLVTDVIMPGKDGAELARQVRQRRPSVPVLFMSGHSDHRLTRYGDIDSETNLLQKPFTPRELLDWIRKLLC